MRLDFEQLQFLARLSKTPDGQYLLGLMQAKLKGVETNLRHQVGEEVHRAQGRALELDDWLGLLSGGAEASLKRSQQTGTSRSQLAPT